MISNVLDSEGMIVRSIYGLRPRLFLRTSIFVLHSVDGSDTSGREQIVYNGRSIAELATERFEAHSNSSSNFMVKVVLIGV